MEITWLFGMIAGLLHLLAFAIYNRQILQGTSQPNAATWTLWAFLSGMNFASYAVMSGDWVKSILPLASSIACVGTFIFSLWKGKLSKIDPWDGLALGIGIISCLAWWYYKSATCANLILQASIVVSFWPTYRSIWIDPTRERSLPWYVWSLGYACLILVVRMRWQGQYQDLVYPVGGLVLHVTVGLLANRKSIAVAVV